MGSRPTSRLSPTTKQKMSRPSSAWVCFFEPVALSLSSLPIDAGASSSSLLPPLRRLLAHRQLDVQAPVRTRLATDSRSPRTVRTYLPMTRAQPTTTSSATLLGANFICILRITMLYDDRWRFLALDKAF